MSGTTLLQRQAEATPPEERATAAALAAAKAEEAAAKAQELADQARSFADIARRAADYTAHLAGGRITENAPAPTRLGIGGNGHHAPSTRTLTAAFTPPSP